MKEIPNRPMRHHAAAQYLGVSDQTLYGKISEGKIRPRKAGKFNLFYKEDLDRFIKGENPAS